MLSKFLQPILFLSTVILVFAACSKNDPSVNATRLRINLTNASPSGRAQELNIDIQKIEVSTVNTGDNTESWTPLEITSGTHDIIPLLSGKTKQISDQYFPAGVLRRIKIVFGDKSGFRTFPTESAGSKPQDLILDPSIKDGIILDVNANLYANYISSILVDINSALAIHESNGNFFFRPALRVYPETYGGSLRGYALPLEAVPVVVIANESDTLLALPEFADGKFLFKGLQEGKWKINVRANPTSGYKDTTFVETISAGKTTELKSKIILKKQKQ